MRISVQPLLPTGSYLNVRIGVELDIPDEGDMKAEINTMWDNLIAIHMERYPNLYSKEGRPLYEGYKGEEQVPEIQLPKEPVTKLSKEEKQKAEISSCTDITVLESYRLIVKKYPYLQDVYDETKEKLTKKD